MLKTPITRLKENPLAKRFFSNMGEDELSIVTKFGSISYVDEDKSVLCFIGEGTTRKAKIVARKINELGYNIEVDTDEFMIQIKNEHLLECAKILGAKEKKKMSEEQKHAAAERLRKLKQENK